LKAGAEFALDRRLRATLEALCRRMAPFADDDERAPSLCADVQARVTRMDPATRRSFAAALRLVDSRVAVTACIGVPLRFSALSARHQDRVLRSWEFSRIPLRRSLFQGLRRLVLSTRYMQPDALREIGWPGPLHRRRPRFRWEGPLPGTPRDDEPVLRGDRTKPLPPALPHSAQLGRGVLRGDAFADGARLRADVCVIGSGAGGAVAAARLAEAGLEVLVVEEGGWWEGSDFTEVESEMVERLYADAGARATDDLAISILQGRCAGGSSTVNWLVMLRAADAVLEEWRTRHGAELFGSARMALAYDRIECETQTRQVPDDAHSQNNRIIMEGARALGWNVSPARINAHGCVRAGSCGLGCRWGAKQGALGVFLPRALAAGARVACDLRADRLEVAERGAGSPLKRLHCTALDPRTGTPRARVMIEAPLIVLAAGAIGTPALLLRSGLGSGGVGRFLRLHPTSAIIGAFDHAIYGSSGIPLSVVCDEFIRRDPHGYGFWIEAPPLSPSLAAVTVPGYGRDHAELMAQFPRLSGTIVLVRDGAAQTPGGRVTVRANGTPRIRYQMSVPDRRHLLDGLAAAARITLAAGARELYTLHTPRFVIRDRSDVQRIQSLPSRANQLGIYSAHVMGSCRVGVKPSLSGCGARGEVHGVPGVFVADGSLMPTAPGVNPQATIMALASIVAGNIIEHRRPH
jgi:choline dehydrogenase-like flavoprotein